MPRSISAVRASAKSIRRLAALLAGLVFALPALAAGVDSRNYSCADLHALIGRTGFVFLNNPDFQDFIVADISACEAASRLQSRTVPARDRRECPVNYCIPAPNSERF